MVRISQPLARRPAATWCRPRLLSRKNLGGLRPDGDADCVFDFFRRDAEVSRDLIDRVSSNETADEVLDPSITADHYRSPVRPIDVDDDVGDGKTWQVQACWPAIGIPANSLEVLDDDRAQDGLSRANLCELPHDFFARLECV